MTTSRVIGFRNVVDSTSPDETLDGYKPDRSDSGVVVPITGSLRALDKLTLLLSVCSVTLPFFTYRDTFC